MKYNKEQRKLIYALVCTRLDRTLDKEDSDIKNSCMWKNVLFLLDRYNSGEFFGTLSIKILGDRCWDIAIQDQTFKMETEYLDLEDKINELK